MSPLIITIICLAILLPFCFILVPHLINGIINRCCYTLTLTSSTSQYIPGSTTDLFRTMMVLLCARERPVYRVLSLDLLFKSHTEEYNKWSEEKCNIIGPKRFLLPRRVRNMVKEFDGKPYNGYQLYVPFGGNVWYTTKLFGRRVWFKLAYEGTDVTEPRVLTIRVPFASTAEIERITNLAWDHAREKHPAGKVCDEKNDDTPPNIVYTRVSADVRGDVNKSAEHIAGRFTSSLVLEDGVLEDLFKYLEEFSGREKVYKALGVPYKTVILLSGAPGTGKSTLPRVLATEYGLELTELVVSGITPKDFELMTSKVSRARPGIILIEDIDATGATTGRRGEKESAATAITLSQILGFLDGNSSPSGIIIITTNHPETFDDAMVRPGRVDYKMDMYGISRSRAWELFTNFLSKADLNSADYRDQFDKEFPDTDGKGVFIPAAIQQFAQKAVFGFAPPLETPVVSPAVDYNDDDFDDMEKFDVPVAD